MPRNGNRHQRGYDSRHDRERARWTPIVATGRIICWRCGHLIPPGAPWDLGHDDNDRTRYRGPEHQTCNRSAGAHKANAGRRRTPDQPITSRRWW